MSVLSILRPGMFTTVQDLGRWGFQSRGVSVSGAMDWYSHRLANLAVGNDQAMATLEVTLMGPHIRFESDATFAVTGAEFRLTLDDTPIEMNRPVDATPGTILKFGERRRGARAYLAIAGGIDVPKVLGSRSTHAVTAIGGHEGRALRAGDVIGIRKGPGATGKRTYIQEKSQIPFLFAGKLRMIAADGPLAARVTSRRFQVSPQSNRMGYRLEGQALDAPNGEIISTAIPTGVIQVPPMGQPILLMNDHATTGGYAMAGTVITADLPLAGQLAPGDWVEFEACSLETAIADLRQRRAALAAA